MNSRRSVAPCHHAVATTPVRVNVLSALWDIAAAPAVHTKMKAKTGSSTHRIAPVRFID